MKLNLFFHPNLFLFTWLILCPLTSLADEIEINVHTRSDPISALGIIFAENKIAQQPGTSFERISEDVVVVKIPYDIDSLPSKMPFVTAYLLTYDNQIVFGDIRLLKFSDSSSSFWRIPICEIENQTIKSQIPLSEQLNYLESLLEVRGKKREVARKLLQDKLTPDFLLRLQKLEKSFGFESEMALSAELSALELVERISRIKNTVALYQSTKNKN